MPPARGFVGRLCRCSSRSPRPSPPRRRTGTLRTAGKSAPPRVRPRAPTRVCLSPAQRSSCSCRACHLQLPRLSGDRRGRCTMAPTGFGHPATSFHFFVTVLLACAGSASRHTAPRRSRYVQRGGLLRQHWPALQKSACIPPRRARCSVNHKKQSLRQLPKGLFSQFPSLKTRSERWPVFVVAVYRQVQVRHEAVVQGTCLEGARWRSNVQIHHGCSKGEPAADVH